MNLRLTLFGLAALTLTAAPLTAGQMEKRELARAIADAALSAAEASPAARADFTLYPAYHTWYEVTEPPPDDEPSTDLSFYVNNPITLYGSVEIPSDVSDRYSDKWQFDGDDAIAIFGVTPPAPMTYYSFIMNEWWHYYDHLGKYAETNSSIGLSINQDNIATMGGEKNDDFFVLIVASKVATAESVRDWFIAKGAPEHAINVMYLPIRFTRQENENPPFVSFLTRVTFRTLEEHRIAFDYSERDPVAINALFFDGPGGPGDVTDEDIPKWEDTLRVDDSEWDANADVKLKVLVERVKAYHESRGMLLEQTGRESLFHIDPDAICRDNAYQCNFDTPDALYGAFLCDTGAGTRAPDECTGTLPDEDDLVVIVGVNHHRFGDGNLGTYFSYATTRDIDKLGVASVLDLDSEGSATLFLRGVPNIDPRDFFVINVSRDCGDNPSCMEVPYPDNPDGLPGVPAAGDIHLTTRFYLDKITASSPNPRNAVPAHLLWFKMPDAQ